MKRFLGLVLAVTFVLGCLTNSAWAESTVDVKVKGTWDFSFGWFSNDEFQTNAYADEYDARNNDNLIAKQRVRTQVNFIVSENLQAVLQFEIGDVHWGRQNQGGALGTDGINVETKHAYLDWMVPGSALHIRMGLQPLVLPHSKLGNVVMDDDVAALVASYQFNETFALTLFWARPFDGQTNDNDAEPGFLYSQNPHLDDEMDMFGLVAPITLDGISITPWFMWANVGAASDYNHTYAPKWHYYNRNTPLTTQDNKRSSAWWVGNSLAITLWDPLTLGFDAVYGGIHMSEKNWRGPSLIPNSSVFQDEIGTRGWFLSAFADYKLDWGTPGIFGCYSSGDSAQGINAGMAGRLPAVSPSFKATSFGYDGGAGINEDTKISTSAIGSWGIGVQIADMSFVEDLSHTVRFAYTRGTNDAEAARLLGSNTIGAENLPFSNANGIGENRYLSDEDQTFEINFDTTYRIYENLSATLELGWIRMDYSEDVWPTNFRNQDAVKVELAFQYCF